MTIKYVNVSNPAAYGVTWTMPETGNQFQLVNPRDTSDLWFGMKTDGQNWKTMSVVDPSRFGLKKPVKTFKAFMVIVRAYVEE